MKKVIRGKELEDCMIKAITLLGDTVGTTLGPKGSNVIINETEVSPYITNDGVTIALNIASEDIAIDTILTLAKEAAIKTNELVGDGTTTTLVLLKTLYLEGLKYVKEGINPIILKKEMDIVVKDIVQELDNKKRKALAEDIKSIASISGNDEAIGDILREVKAKVGNNIILKEGNKRGDEVNYLKGYYIDTILASSFFFKDTKEINISNPKVLLVNDFIDGINDINDVFNYVAINNPGLVIIAKDYSEEFIKEILNYYLDDGLNIWLLKWPGYGEELIDIEKDIASIVGKSIVNKCENITLDSLGSLNNIIINQDKTILSFESNDYIKDRIEKLKQEKDKEQNIAMLTKGLAEILVGGLTTLERREKKMRYEDAINAIKNAEYVLPGCGIAYYQISEELKPQNNAQKIFKKALAMPIKKILYNAGGDEAILERIKESNFQKLYNVAQERFEDIKDTTVIDSYLVVINSLINANAIATLLLTTTSLVINENKIEREIDKTIL